MLLARGAGANGLGVRHFWAVAKTELNLFLDLGAAKFARDASSKSLKTG